MAGIEKGTMMRLIDAINKAFERVFAWDGTSPLGDKVLENVPSAQPEQQWIPCSERLPEVRQWVLCQCRAGIMDVLRLTEDGSWDKNYPRAEYMSGFVVAWMPLPKPYEVKE